MPSRTAPETPALKVLLGRAPQPLECYLQPVVAKAYAALRRAAKRDGIELFCVSGYRSFKHQQQIWQRKAQRLSGQGLSPAQALENMLIFSAPPGLSRHHWGTEVDLIADTGAPWPEDPLLPEHFRTGPFAPLRRWLEANAMRFDFHLIYTDAPGRTGHAYEPWHYSYLPLSEHYQAVLWNTSLTDLHSAVFRPDWSAASKPLAQIQALLDENWLEHYRTRYAAAVGGRVKFEL